MYFVNVGTSICQNWKSDPRSDHSVRLGGGASDHSGSSRGADKENRRGRRKAREAETSRWTTLCHRFQCNPSYGPEFWQVLTWFIYNVLYRPTSTSSPLTAELIWSLSGKWESLKRMWAAAATTATGWVRQIIIISMVMVTMILESFKDCNWRERGWVSPFCAKKITIDVKLLSV